MLLRDDSWLSLTPEPERLLPEARAALRSGETPPPAALAERGATASDPAAASAALVRDVIANHDALVLGLPGERKGRRR